MLNEWIEQIKACDFVPELFFDKTGIVQIALWPNKPSFNGLRLFNGVDPDELMTKALEYAQLYDAYVNTASGCGVVH